MSTQIVGCNICGHQFKNFYKNQYFTESHANYYSQQPAFFLSWCRQCSGVSVYTPKTLRILGDIKLKKSFQLSDVATEEYWHLPSQHLGSIAGAHLLRMIWNSFVRFEENLGNTKNANEKAMHQAMKMLPASEVAIMVYMTITARNCISVEQQILEGKYIQDMFVLSDFMSWIDSYPDVADAALVRRNLNRIAKNCGFDLNRFDLPPVSI